MPLTVELSNRGNPDFGQDPRRPLPGTRASRLTVESLEAASAACRRYIERHGLGGGNWTGGSIKDDAGAEVGTVSYNGVVWAPGGYKMGAEPLFDPRPKAVETVKDPHAWEKAVVEVPGHGAIEVTGCYRVASATTVPGRFKVGGRVVEFTEWMQVERDGSVRMLRPVSLHPEGKIDATVRLPADFMASLDAALAEWASRDDNFGLFVRNEIKDQRRSIEVLERNIRFKEEEIAKLRAEADEARKAIAELEAVPGQDRPFSP